MDAESPALVRTRSCRPSASTSARRAEDGARPEPSERGEPGKPAVVNLGTRPTFEGKGQRFEAHLLDYDGDLYGKRLSVSLVSRLRDERKFDGVEELATQISEDIVEARRRLAGAGVPLDARNRSTDGG